MQPEIKKPTPEQQNCVDKFSTREALRINAYAGTGKTTTLKTIARSTSRRGTYLAFNKSIASEAAKEFPRNVTCKTTHALAFASCVRDYGMDRMLASVNGGILASKMRLREFDVASDFSLSPRAVGYLVSQALVRFMRSDAPTLRPSHVPTDGRIAMVSDAERSAIVAHVYGLAVEAWGRMVDVAGDLPVGHDGYLKIWALKRPQIAGDFVMLDEAQDTNGVVLGVIQEQGGQVVAVGDRHQQIYEWRGAQNAMVALPAKHEARLTTSFRFGPAIAGMASRVLATLDETLPLIGNPDRPCTVTRSGSTDGADAILCRTNARLIEHLFEHLDAGLAPHVIGGVGELRTVFEGVARLMAGRPCDRPAEFFGFSKWADVVRESEKPEGQELQRWVRLIDAWGLDNLRDAIDAVQSDEAGADIVLATGHKSKGREWSHAYVDSDFFPGVQAGNDGTVKVPSEELRLFYVAVTRGKTACTVAPEAMDKFAAIEAAQKRPAVAAA